MSNQKYIAYIRVSSKGQEQNTSFENQQRMVNEFSEKRGGEILETISEVVSGAKTLRKGILRAIELCKKENAILLVAKIDRLCRETTLLTKLETEKVKFVCANMPEATELVIGIMVVIAKYEKQLINERTNAGKKATIEKYGKLHHIKGSSWVIPTLEQRNKGYETIKEKAEINENNTKALAMAKALRSAGNSPAEILLALQKSKFKTSRGGEFTQIVQVQRLLAKAS